MAFTKIVGAGIHTLSNVHTHNINSSGIITATNFVGPFDGTTGNFSGNVTIDGNLIVNGDTTTLNTTLREVEILRVDANSSATAGIITQTGAGDLLRLYDGTSQVVTVDDEGNVGLGSAIPAANLDINGTLKIHDGSGYDNHITYHQNPASIRFPTGPLANLAKTPYLGFGDRTAGGDFKIYHDYYNTHLKLSGLGGLYISNASTSGVIGINGANGSGGTQSSIRIDAGANQGVKLYHGGNLRLETVGYGVTVLGTTETQQLNVTGVSTFSGIATASSTLFAEEFSTSGIGTFADIHVKNPVDTRITSIAPGALILSRDTPIILFKNNLSDSFDASIDVVSNELRFKGGGNNATSTRMITTSSGVSFPQNIDVDGQTHLDDVSITGVTTITGGTSPFQVGHTGGAGVRITRNSKYLDINANWGGSNTHSAINFGNSMGFALYSSNSEKLRIDASGRVGINTTSPENADSVQIFGTTTPMLTIKAGASGSDTNRRATLMLWTGGNKVYKLQADASDGGLKILDSSTPRLVIDSSGRILTGGETAAEVTPGGIHVKTVNDGANSNILILENHGSSSDTTVTLKLVPSTSTPNDRYNSIKAINVDGQNKFDTVFHTCPGGTPLEAMRIDNQQRVIIGTQYTDQRHEVGHAALQVSGTGPSDSAIAVGRWSNNNQPAFLELSKSRATSITGHTAVVADDILGQVQFSGSDGTRYLGAAFIKGIATNPIADYDVAGYLSFGTNYGTTSPTERLRIRSTGEVSLGQVDDSSTSALHIRSVTSTETTLELSTKSNYSGSLPSAKISFTQQNGTEIARIKCDTNTGAANMADLTFWTNYGGLYERMRIIKTGPVQIHSGSNSSGSLRIGGNYDSTGTTNNTAKLGTLMMPHYTNAEEPIQMIRGYSDSAQTLVSIGGGTSSANAATNIRLYTSSSITGTGTERLRITNSGEVGFGLTQDPPTGSFTVRLTETPEFNLYSTQHSQNNNCKINFGIGQSASVSGNTGARIEMNIPNAGGQMTGELKFYTNIGDNLQERLRITHLGGTVINKGGTINTASGWAALEAKAGSSAHQVVLSSTATASNSNYATLGFKLHPSNDNERVKAAIQCQGSGGGYGEVSRMMFCLDNIADNGSAQGNSDDERFRISPTTGVQVRRDKFGWSTFGHYTGSARTLLRHVKEFGTGSSAATFNLIRVRRHYWGWGHYKFTIKRAYYSGIAEDVYYLNGHGRDDGSYSPSYSIGQRQYGGDGSNFGYSNRITITSPSTSSPGSSYAAYVDVQLQCPAYMYFQVEVEGYASAYSTDYTSLASDQYALI